MDGFFPCKKYVSFFINCEVKVETGEIFLQILNQWKRLINSIQSNTCTLSHIKIKIDFKVLNDLNFQKINLKKFPVIKLIKSLPKKDSLFETVLVSANDCLVENFLQKKIKFIDISKILFQILKKKEFQKYKLKKPTNIDQIRSINKYVRLKINDLCV